MTYTERDLEVARRHVLTLQHFIAEHRRLVAQSPWDQESKVEAERLLVQFETVLEERYNQVWANLNSDADSTTSNNPH
jgi:hypothetical protein